MVLQYLNKQFIIYGANLKVMTLLIVGSGISGRMGSKKKVKLRRSLKSPSFGEVGPDLSKQVQEYKNATKAILEIPHRGRRTVGDVGKPS